MNRIPIFEAKINQYDEGIFAIALVDIPAVESNFLCFNKNEKAIQKFTINDEEQHVITGVVMRANYPIYRNDSNFGEYFIVYKEDTIKIMAQKMMLDKTFNNINIMHNDNNFVDGVNIVELFIKDSSKGISPKGFEDIEEGSLFATYKVNNERIWNDIKKGEFMGFSLEGYFSIEETNKYIEYNKNKRNQMSTLFNKFLKSFVKCGSVETDKGTLYWVGEADLQIGDEVFYNTENEEAVKVEDGEYTLTDGTVIVVKEGLVSEIREKDGEQEGELDMEKKKECMEEEVIVEEPVEEPKDDRYDELKADIDDLRKEHDELKGIVEELKNTLNAILEKPAAEPIVEEFEKVAKLHTNDTKLNNALSVIGSVKRKK